MANPEHVERLLRSVYEWNTWRQEHPEIRPDLINADLINANLTVANLSGAKLRGADLITTNLISADLRVTDLRESNLHGADLSEANLSSADLSRANLYGAKLSRANLSEANLEEANLYGAKLNRANLSGANLREANLRSADLIEANLHSSEIISADLSNAYFSSTIFIGIDLSSMKGLETALHYGRSIVDINSVTLPTDERIRNHFLRGVGFSDNFIDYLPSLLTIPIQYHSLFLSHSHHDQVFTKRLHDDLQNKGVRCWFAPHDLRPGTPILRGIEEAIHLQDKFLLILSRDAINSAWIEREVDAALHQEIKRGQDVLFPIRLDNAVLESHAGWAERLQHRHIGDFTHWQDETVYQQAFTALLRHLKVP